MSLRLHAFGILGALALSSFALFAAGCPAPDPAGGLATTKPPDQLLDYNDFVCNVEPVLIKRCSYLGCHGNADHGLRVYSLGKLRLGDASTRQARSNTPLSADEVELNFESASGMVYGTSAVNRMAPNIPLIPILSKPLAARFGGAEHQGVAIFPTYPNTTLDSDGEWNALRDWVTGAAEPNPPVPSCVALFAAMGLSPRSM